MKATEVVDAVVRKLGDSVLAVKRPEGLPRRAYVDVKAEDIVAVSRTMFADFHGRLATVSGVDVRDGAEILYHWCIERHTLDPPAEGEPPCVVVTVRALAPYPDLVIDSIVCVTEAANWIEREIHDLLGVSFTDHPDMRRLILADDWPEGVYPLRRDFDVAAFRRKEYGDE
jgi:NADH:ubiquinone oxidoreductase subunit C